MGPHPAHSPPTHFGKDIGATAACFTPCNRRFWRLQGRFPVLRTSVLLRTHLGKAGAPYVPLETCQRPGCRASARRRMPSQNGELPAGGIRGPFGTAKSEAYRRSAWERSASSQSSDFTRQPPRACVGDPSVIPCACKGKRRVREGYAGSGDLLGTNASKRRPVTACGAVSILVTN